jgi:hypothetical protein
MFCVLGSTGYSVPYILVLGFTSEREMAALATVIAVIQ